MLIICMLSEQRNSGLSVIEVELRHIQVINEVDHYRSSRRSILSTSLFYQCLLKLTL